MPWILSITLVLGVLLLGISYYTGRRLSGSIAAHFNYPLGRVRRIVWSFLAYLNLLPLVALAAFLIGGRAAVSAFSGDNLTVDILLTYPFWIALVINVQLLLLFVVLDLVSLSSRFLFHAAKERTKAANARWGFYGAVVIILFSFVTIYRDTWTFRITHQEVSLPEKFACLDGLTIAHISDVQGDGRTTEQILMNYVEAVNNAHPDLVLFSGDLVTGGEAYIESSAKALGRLKSRYGTFAAVGDHDIFSNKRKVLANLRLEGITVLEDTTMVLRMDSCAIQISGVTYTYPQRPRESKLDSLVSRSPDFYKIFLVHQPANVLVAKAQEADYQLFLAGHTHGGGVAFGIPGFGLYSPASLESRYVSGLYHVGSLVVNVTNGLGFTLAPIRFNAPAEITILKLTK
ncbi:MAG: metallophosphoesterase [Bacteroidota bacterium]